MMIFQNNSPENTARMPSQSNATRSPENLVRPTPRARLFKILYASLLTAVTYSFVLVLCLRWIPPWTSMFMLQHYFVNLFEIKSSTPLKYQWVPWEALSKQVPLAVVAAEDQKFPDHRGFDFESISTALERNRTERRIRGASTITQQAAKNLFLWSGKFYIRKGLEAYFTVLLELLWSKQRILEVYVNIAEFGEGVYGVQAASQKYFRKDARQLIPSEAALLAAVLPNPNRFKVNRPSNYVLERKLWIMEQMEQLGGISYLPK
jgi:monofunctional biosynthetic peptidoglycan transglycosylase